MSLGRSAQVNRQTGETAIRVHVNLDGSGKTKIHSGIGFLDHMLDLLGRHSLIDLEVEAQGDLHIDDHHTCEDIGIALGQAIDKALGNRAGIRRYGHMTLPMDEALITSAVDLGGRFSFHWNASLPSPKIGTFDSELVEHFWESWAVNARSNLHVLMHHGRNSHHIAEGIFKSIAKSLRMAVEKDPRSDAVPSTKGTLTV
jgi:imidazoleglycerol-phosphate dehydratase